MIPILTLVDCSSCDLQKNLFRKIHRLKDFLKWQMAWTDYFASSSIRQDFPRKFASFRKRQFHPCFLERSIRETTPDFEVRDSAGELCWLFT